MAYARRRENLIAFRERDSIARFQSGPDPRRSTNMTLGYRAAFIDEKIKFPRLDPRQIGFTLPRPVQHITDLRITTGFLVRNMNRLMDAGRFNAAQRVLLF